LAGSGHALGGSAFGTTCSLNLKHCGSINMIEPAQIPCLLNKQAETKGMTEKTANWLFF
jgi:hypothetical protein